MSRRTSPPALPLWQRIEALRLREGWTRIRLAQRAGVSRGTIENWKTQPRVPQAETVKLVADNLGIDYDEALRLAGITRVPPPPDEGPAEVKSEDVDLEELMQDPEARAALRTIIRRIRGEPTEPDSPGRDEEAG